MFFWKFNNKQKQKGRIKKQSSRVSFYFTKQIFKPLGSNWVTIFSKGYREMDESNEEETKR